MPIQFFHIFLTSILLATAQMLIRRGVVGLEFTHISPGTVVAMILKMFQNVWLISGVVLFAVSFTLYLFVLLRFQISVVYPIMIGTGAILVLSFANIFFKESLSLIQLLGVVLILAGVFLLAPKS